MYADRNVSRPERYGQWLRPVLMSAVLSVSGIMLGQGILLAPAMAAVSPAKQSQPDGLSKARALVKSGQIPAAVIELKNLLRANPKNVDARVELASIYLQANDGVSSEKEWRAAMLNGYPFEKALDGLGLSLLIQGQAPRLLKEFEGAKYSGELKARVHLFRAQAHMALTEVEFAKKEVTAAQAVAPNYFGVHLAASRLRQGEGDIKAAEAEADKALALAPTNADAQIQKGELRGAQGDAVGALGYFNRVLAVNKNDLRARLGRVATLVSQRKAGAAEGEIDDILKVAPGSPVATYFKALLLAQHGKMDEALARLGRINGVEKLPPALYLLAALHLGKGQVEQAQKYIDVYVAKAPDDMRGQLLMVSLKLARGEVAASIPKLEEIKSKLPNDYTTSLLLGNAYLSLGRFADATVQFQSATTASPQALEASMGLAQSLLGQGKSDESAKILQTLASEGHGTNRASALLVLSLLQSKDFKGALKAASDFAAKEPKNPAGPYLKASVDAARGDRKATRTDLQQALSLDAKFIPAELTLAQIDRAEGKHGDAQIHYKNILAHTPASIEAHVGLATIAIDSGDKKSALEWLKKASNANPTAPAPRLLTINFLLVDGQAPEALKEASDFASKFPNNPVAIDALGVSQLVNRDAKGAVNSFAKLVSMMPNSAIAHIKLASAYRVALKNDEARRSLEAALKIDPASFDARRAMIDLVLTTTGPAAAINMAQVAQSSIRDKIAGELLLADTYRAAGKLVEAEAAYKAVWKTNPTVALLSAYTQTLEAQGKFAPARAVLSEWLSTHKGDGNARFMLVVNSISSGQYAVALKEGQALLKERPKDVALLNNVAWLYDRTGNVPKAIELAEQALAQAPASAEINDTLGWLLVRNNKLERGMGLLKTGHELAPRNPEIGYHYAFALNQSGKGAAAKTVVVEALKNPQNFAERQDAEKFMQSLK